MSKQRKHSARVLVDDLARCWVPLIVNIPADLVDAFRDGLAAGRAGVPAAQCPFSDLQRRRLWLDAHSVSRRHCDVIVRAI